MARLLAPPHDGWLPTPSPLTHLPRESKSSHAARGSHTHRSSLQEERSQCLWAALERVIPDVRQRAELQLVGTPLTHERYLR